MPDERSLGLGEIAYQESIELLFQEIVKDLGYEGWQLRWPPRNNDCYCDRDNKIIDICPVDVCPDIEQALLHEIAHIGVIEESNQHSRRFWEHLKCLAQHYLGCELNKYHKEWAEAYSRILKPVENQLPLPDIPPRRLRA